MKPKISAYFYVLNVTSSFSTMNMDVLCSNRSQEVLKEYGEIRSVVRILSEGREIGKSLSESGD